ncbi:ATP-binding protein [Streptomyces sp. NPDC088251]|uniref:ATP-binding protein n=1 Tax=unclassified Streptomyces TaxID=2593676 RepID=UPI003820A5B7
MPETHSQHRGEQAPRSHQPPGPADLAPHLSLGAPPFAAHRIQNTTSCLKEARQFTAEVLHRWSLDLVREDTVQIASELVANAVRHGRRRTPLPDGSAPAVWLALTRRPQTLLCIVYDPSPRRPHLTLPAPLSERHRGLPIVRALSEDWGWKPSGHTGKAVWARVPLHPPDTQHPGSRI